jgi:hypothetical protein
MTIAPEATPANPLTDVQVIPKAPERPSSFLIDTPVQQPTNEIGPEEFNAI